MSQRQIRRTAMIFITPKEQKAIVKVFDYLYTDEKKHYEENPTSDHIFHSLKNIERLAKALKKKDMV